MNTHIRTHTVSHKQTHTVGYSLWLWCVKVGREEGGAGEGGGRHRGRAGCFLFLVVDLDCFLQVGVATSLWSFVEMIQPEPGTRVRHVTWKRGECTLSFPFQDVIAVILRNIC